MQGSAVHPSSFTDDGRYRLLIESITDYAIYMLGIDGVVSSWNAGAQRFKGYTAHEIIGQNFSRFYSKDDQAKGLPARSLETAARDGKFEAEGWRIRKDGTRFWAHVVIDPIRSQSGELIGFAKITRDLSERKLAEGSLRRSEEQFRLLVQGVTDYAIYMLDPTGHVTNWNIGAQRIKGYAPDEIIGEHFSRFYTDEDRARGAPQRALDTAAAEGRFEKEGWRLRKDGTRFWAHVIIDPIKAEDGSIIGYAKVTRDVTERQQTQEALNKARDALFQSQKMEAVGQLTGGVAHDFNNLLMVILSSLALVRKRLPDDPKAVRLIDNAIQGAERGASLTQRMLAFARRQDLTPEPVSIQALVTGMTDLLQRSLGPSIQIETRFPLSLKPVLADPHQLEMALLNLAVNARDAMSGGGLVIIAAREETLSADRDGLTAGQYVCMALIDSGEGMDEATLDRAMEPFFTTKGVGKGTGLGLSMVHGMAEQLGGRFILKSRKGEGTTAEIWLPLAQSAPGSGAHGTDSASLSFLMRPLVIVAVDDDALVLMNTIAMLEELGHTAHEAHSGKEALEIVRREKTVDLVITDHAMPHMTGTELVEALRAEYPDIVAILATGYAELPAGAPSTLPRLSKPFDQDILAKAIVDTMRQNSKL